MNQKEEEKLILDRLRNLCSKAEKCKKDISMKLLQWHFEGDMEEIIGTLEEEGFINEQRFAQSFANDKIKFGKWGKGKVRYLLKQKGIPVDYIDLAIEIVSEPDYVETVKKEILKKNKTLKAKNEFERKKKLYAFAIQRGYESDISLQIIEKIIQD